MNVIPVAMRTCHLETRIRSNENRSGIHDPVKTVLSRLHRQTGVNVKIAVNPDVPVDVNSGHGTLIIK